MDLREIRRINLTAITSPYKKKVDCANDLEMDPSHLSQILNDHRGMGERVARKIEITAGLEPMSLDRPPGVLGTGDTKGRYQARPSKIERLLDKASTTTRKTLEDIAKARAENALANGDMRVIGQIASRLAHNKKLPAS